MAGKADFETLVDAHGEELYRYLWRMLGSDAEAQDCLQDAYLRAYKAYGRLDEDANTRAWLYKIAGNCARTALKKRGRQAGLSDEMLAVIADGRKGMDARLVQQEQLQAVHTAVMDLPHKQRAALLLRKYQQLDYAEIAAALNCSQDSARANVYQGLKKVRSKLDKEE